MYSSVINKLSKNLTDVKSIIRWQENLRTSLFAPTNPPAPISIEAASLLSLQNLAPSKVAWQLFDHCAAVSRIYGLFEQAVNELVAEYIAFIPNATPVYSNLHEDTRVQYRLGVAQILSKWKSSKSLYSHLAEDNIAAGLADGLRNNKYTLLADAFLVDSDNYRTDTINRIFKRFGYDNVFAWIQATSSIVNFCSNIGSQSADGYLNEFVRVRNEAAHGNVASISSAKEILEYAEFVELVVIELASLLTTRMVRDGVATGHTVKIGTVLHNYSNNIVGILSSASLPIKNGDMLYAGKKRLELVNVVSLRINSDEQLEIQLTPSLEFGMMLDKNVPEGASLYRCLSN